MGQLSRDGTQAVLRGQADGIFLSGLLDLATTFYTALGFSLLDLDADASRLVTGGFNYSLIDLETSTVTAITDQEPVEDVPPTCRPYDVGRPRISADGTVVVFATTLILGGPPGCNLIAYDASSGDTRVVHAFGDAGPVAPPSMDDAGEQVLVLLPPLQTEDAGPRRLALIRLADGASTPLLAGAGVDFFDGLLSGDGTAAVFSSCGDFDPRVGNPDFNEELFRLDLASGAVTQLTDTRGGPQSCVARGAEPLSPQVSRDAEVVAYRGQGFGPAYCGNPGPQRDQRSGLAFGQARTVRVVADNHPPILDLEGGVVLRFNEVVDTLASAADSDGDPLILFAELDDLDGLPASSEFRIDRQNTGVARFIWYTSVADVGEHTLRVGGFDGRGGEAVGTVRISVCRMLADDPIGDVVTAIFGSQPVACGSGDANGDGVATAADLLVPR